MYGKKIIWGLFLSSLFFCANAQYVMSVPSRIELTPVEQKLHRYYKVKVSFLIPKTTQGKWIVVLDNKSQNRPFLVYLSIYLYAGYNFSFIGDTTIRTEVVSSCPKLIDITPFVQSRLSTGNIYVIVVEVRKTQGYKRIATGWNVFSVVESWRENP